MLAQTVLDAAKDILQAAYMAANNTDIQVVSYWPDPTAKDPALEWIVVHEGTEYETILGEGMRGNNGAKQDVLLLTYYQKSLSSQRTSSAGVTFVQVQQRMRAAKLVLATGSIFTNQNPASLNLNGTVLRVGDITFLNQEQGPYDPTNPQREVRLSFRAYVEVFGRVRRGS